MSQKVDQRVGSSDYLLVVLKAELMVVMTETRKDVLLAAELGMN